MTKETALAPFNLAHPVSFIRQSPVWTAGYMCSIIDFTNQSEFKKQDQTRSAIYSRQPTYAINVRDRQC